jgi:hypothetical protein
LVGALVLQLVQKLSGQSATVEQMRRLAKEIAVENGILLDFPEDTREVPHAQVGCNLLHDFTTAAHLVHAISVIQYTHVMTVQICNAGETE